MLPIEGTVCSAINFYSARCSILHTLTPLSNLSDLGEARRIVYSWGNSTNADLDLAIEKKRYSCLVVLHVNDLFEAFPNGWKDFIEAQRIEKTRSSLFEKKA